MQHEIPDDKEKMSCQDHQDEKKNLVQIVQIYFFWSNIFFYVSFFLFFHGIFFSFFVMFLTFVLLNLIGIFWVFVWLWFVSNINVSVTINNIFTLKIFYTMTAKQTL